VTPEEEEKKELQFEPLNGFRLIMGEIQNQ
jgi:hypothetical protein